MKIIIKEPEDILNIKLPVIFLDGEEYYIKMEIVKILKEKYTKTKGGIFNFQEINPDNWENFQTFSSNILQMGFFSRRFILINYFERFSKKNQKDILNIIMKSGFTPNGPIFILIVTGGRIDNSNYEMKKILNQIIASNNMGYFYSYPLQKDELKKRIIKYVNKHGKKIDRSHIDYILNTIDNDLLSIIRELDKIILYVGEKENIELTDIDEALGDFKIVSLFDFCEATLFGQRDKALLLLDRIIDESTSHWDLRLLQVLWWTFKRNVYISHLITSKTDEKIIYKQINAPFHKKNEILARLKTLTHKHLNIQSTNLLKLEMYLKTQASNNILKRKAIEDFIFQIPLLNR